MTQEYKVRVNLKLTQLTHKLLKVWCAEQELTLQRGASRLIEEGVKRKAGALAMGLVQTAPGVYSAPPASAITTSAPLWPAQAPTVEGNEEIEEFDEYDTYDPDVDYRAQVAAGKDPICGR